MSPEQRKALAAREQARIDVACFRLMSDPDLAPLRLWWEGETLRAVMPPGALDPLRLAMNQGDRERYLAVMQRAERWRQAQAREGES